MDTGTHITMGFGLAGLAYLDPAVSAQPELAAAVMFGTVLGSNAPDFDYGIKIVKGNGMYTEHHRGFSHSIPAWFLWTGFLTALIYPFYSNLSSLDFLHLSGWIFLAVILHVMFDIFNAYGTQAGRPFTNKWLSLNFIPLFDPLIIFLHLLGFALWGLLQSPGMIFLIVYGLIGMYLIERYYSSKRILTRVNKQTETNGTITFIPTILWSVWHIVIETETEFQVGEMRSRNIVWIHSFEKNDQDPDIIAIAKNEKNIKHFLNNSKHVHTVAIPIHSGYEVRFFDLRFRTKNHYPYMAVCQMNSTREIVSSCTGWFHQTEKIKNKLLTQERAAKTRIQA
ncbi:metal-dependent hydrolase [Metabacillus idriensis]|uniref:metal-dependent hydrolase n=1 Tax=Metabacillus idriensis TaxID=324768 RepID=UPI001748041E|nr:metal-dependent hydrolase [Metabacillus idriensis]